MGGQQGRKRLEMAIVETTAAAKSGQSCPTLCDPIDAAHQAPRPWDSPGKNTGVGCHCLPWRQLLGSTKLGESGKMLSEEILDLCFEGLARAYLEEN